MEKFEIKKIKGREILDSRGRPTAEAEVFLAGGGWGRAQVPSGASTGSREALELRDGDPSRYWGRGVRDTVIWNINGEIQRSLLGKDARNQRALDKTLIDLDGSEGKSKSRLGANSILAVSLAAAHAAANEMRVELYQYIRQCLYDVSSDHDKFWLPTPMMNFFNGGAHADNALDFQEFILVPHGAKSFEQAMEWASEVYLSMRRRFKASSLRVVDDVSFKSFGVGDEGGFSIQTPPGMGPRDTLRFALRILTEVVEKANHSIARDGDFGIALDPAASEFFVDGYYVLGKRQKEGNTEYLQPKEMLAFYEELVDTYPIISIEDGMAENDEEGWKLLTERLGRKCQLVGDDVFVTNPDLLKAGISNGIANSILIKVNQIGTLTEALDVVKIAQENEYRAIVSHRSGETEDTTISDIAVAVNAGQIKTGCLSRADRVAKYNRLLRIAQELGPSAYFDGRIATRDTGLRQAA